MADQTVLDTLYNFGSSVYQTVKEADPTNLLKTFEGVFLPTDYTFDSDVFPEDLGAEYMNHYMIMRFYTARGTLPLGLGPFANAPTGSNPFASGFKQNNYNVALYLPSEAGGGIFPNFSDTHEYPDISMSNILLNQIAASGSFAKASVAAGRAGAALSGRAINPGVQVLYKTTHLRTFEFAFLFAPRSENESKSMESIIKKIRKYSAPLDEGVFYRAPAEVEIEFHFNGKINPHIIKMKRQVVTYVDVNYAPHGTYSTFTNGHPVSCMLALKTREMEIIDRKDVEDGF